MYEFIIGDAHVPFQDEGALKVVMKMIQYYKPKRVIMNGDMLDCASLSKFSKEPQEPAALQKQIIELCNIISDIQKYTKVIYIEGNHEARLTRYINTQAQELYGLVSMKDLLNKHLKKKIDYIQTTPSESMYDMRPDLVVGHFKRVSKYTCYSVKLLVDDYHTNVVQAHTHRLGQYAIRAYNQTHRGFEGGCLCNIAPDYVANPNWQQGFLIFSEIDDRWNIESVTIHDGKTLFRGRIFKG